jgi:hypothetical protein
LISSLWARDGMVVPFLLEILAIAVDFIEEKKV